jgi:hypothetical protein
MPGLSWDNTGWLWQPHRFIRQKDFRRLTKSVVKRMKTPHFARAVSRDRIMNVKDRAYTDEFCAQPWSMSEMRKKSGLDAKDPIPQDGHLKTADFFRSQKYDNSTS